MSSYLLLTLFLSVLAGLLLATSHRRRLLLTSGLAAAPAGLLDFIFTPEYWQPNQVFGAAFSIEGVLFSFANGVIIAWFAFAPWRAMFVRPRAGVAVARSLAIAIPCWLAFFIVWHRGFAWVELTIMHASLAGLCLALVILLGRRSEAWALALVAGGGFAAIYFVELLVWRLIDNGAPTLWNHDTAWGVQIIGFPAEELAWAGLYGAVWALAVAYGASVHLRPKTVW